MKYVHYTSVKCSKPIASDREREGEKEMKKKFLRCISLLLAVIMLAEMLPTAWFASFLPRVYAADTAAPTETYTVPVAAPTDNTITTDIPPTIIDDTDTDDEDTITGNAAAAGTPTIDISDIINTSKPECSEDDAHFIAILKQSAAFSALSAADAAFLVDYTHIPASSFSEMEAGGISLWDSVTYGTLAIEAECPVSTVLALDLSLDAVRRITQELATLQAVLRAELSGTELSRELKQYILYGHSCVRVLNAYGVSQVFGIRMAKLSFLCGAVMTVLMAVSAPVILHFVKLTPQAAEYLKQLFGVLAFYMIGRSVNEIIINGVFGSGGDTMFDMYSLAVTMWGIAIPLAVAGTYFLNWPVVVVYACTCVDEVGKIPWTLIHFKKYKWVKDLTR